MPRHLLTSLAATAAAVLLAACGASAPKAGAEVASAASVASAAPAAPAVGGQGDAQDCLPAAGQTWSKLLKSCVQVFNVADLSLPDPDNPTLAVYAIFSPDKKQAEVFAAGLPGGSVLMTRMNSGYVSGYGRVLLLKDSERKEGWRIAK